MTSTLPDEDRLELSLALETATNSFIVVIRSQAGPTVDRPSNWHGSVEHAQSRERMHFIECARLGEFIAAHTQTPLLDPWHMRLARRWQRSALQRWLNPLKSPALCALLPGNSH